MTAYRAWIIAILCGSKMLDIKTHCDLLINSVLLKNALYFYMSTLNSDFLEKKLLIGQSFFLQNLKLYLSLNVNWDWKFHFSRFIYHEMFWKIFFNSLNSPWKRSNVLRSRKTRSQSKFPFLSIFFIQKNRKNHPFRITDLIRFVSNDLE